MIDDARLLAYLDDARQKIAARGHLVQYVGGDRDSGAPGYAYTVGLMQQGLPHELLMVGLPPELTMRLLNDAADRMKKGEDWTGPALYSELLIDFDVALMPVEVKRDEVFTIARALFPEEALVATQIVIPDPKGLFPWQEGCNPTYRRMQTAICNFAAEPPQPSQIRFH